MLYGDGAAAIAPTDFGTEGASTAATRPRVASDPRSVGSRARARLDQQRRERQGGQQQDAVQPIQAERSQLPGQGRAEAQRRRQAAASPARRPSGWRRSAIAPAHTVTAVASSGHEHPRRSRRRAGQAQQQRHVQRSHQRQPAAGRPARTATATQTAAMPSDAGQQCQRGHQPAGAEISGQNRRPRSRQRAKIRRFADFR